MHMKIKEEISLNKEKRHNHDNVNNNHSHHNHDDHIHNEHQNHSLHHSHDEHNHQNHGSHHGDGAHDHHNHGDFKKIFLLSLPIGLIIMWISPLMGLNIPFPFQYTFPYSDIVATVLSFVLIMLLGHWIEMVALGKAGDAQESLAMLLPKQANLVSKNEKIIQVSIADLKIGNIIQVQAGENVPADGIIIRGESRVNESLLTGESKPISKKVGDTVIGGSTNGEGVLFVEVRETGDKSFLSQVQTLVADAQNQPSRSEDMAHKVAGWLFYIALFVAIISLIVWWIVNDLQSAISFAVTTLVIACPHALGLAIPLVISRSTSLGAARGLLVKNREAYELTTKADIMILDKTGTLTTGEFKVLSIESLDKNYTQNQILEILAGIESGSSHPIAISIINHSKEKNVTPLNFDNIDVITGKGIEGNIKDDKYSLISKKAFSKEVEIEEIPGATVSILTKNEKAIGAVSLGDQLKESSKHLINVLREKKITPIMATGDNENAAKVVAEALDIEYYANQSPQDKYNLVEKLKNDDKTVIMVGDGINDAPSLALADVGIAIGAGTQVAIDSADVVLTQSEPGDIESFIELSFRTNRKMNQNLVWGAGYNFLAIPLAAGILAPVGLIISPAIGAILMSLSTVIVAINAMALRLDN